MSSSLKNEMTLPYLEFNPKGKSVVVVVHGVTGSHYLLRRLGEFLAKDYHVLIPNLPGHAGKAPLNIPHNPESYAEWLKNFCQQKAKGKDFFLVGHSYGCLVVLSALKYNLFRAAIIVTPPVSSFIYDLINNSFASFGSILPEQWQRKYLYMFMPWFIAPNLIAKKTEGNLRIVRKVCRAENELFYPKAVIDSMLSVPDNVRHLSKQNFRKPIVAISSEKDKIAPIGLSKKTWHLNPSLINSFVIADTGHQVFVDSPKQINEKVLQSLSKLTKA